MMPMVSPGMKGSSMVRWDSAPAQRWHLGRWGLVDKMDFSLLINLTRLT